MENIAKEIPSESRPEEEPIHEPKLAKENCLVLESEVETMQPECFLLWPMGKGNLEALGGYRKYIRTKQMDSFLF